jgi:hypothetical protein
METKTKEGPDSNMEAFIQERTQQLFLLSDRERKGFIVKRDMQVRIHFLVEPGDSVPARD